MFWINISLPYDAEGMIQKLFDKPPSHPDISDASLRDLLAPTFTIVETPPKKMVLNCLRSYRLQKMRRMIYRNKGKTRSDCERRRRSRRSRKNQQTQREVDIAQNASSLKYLSRNCSSPHSMRIKYEPNPCVESEQ